MKKFIKLVITVMVICMMPLAAQEVNPITDFEYDFNEDVETLHIKKYTGTSPTVVFPAEIEGFKVTRIIDRVLSDNARQKVTSIVIPEGIEIIYYYAFEYAGNLKSVQLPSTLKGIGDSAFESTRIEKIVIPAGVEILGRNVFDSCYYLKEVELPDTLKTIGAGTFRRTGIEKIVIPASVEKLLTGYNPYSDDDIWNSTFGDCKSLKSVILPDTLKEIGERTFEGCVSLTDINIPASVTEIKDYTFYGCTSLTDIDIPDSVTYIGSGSFYGCASLTNINIPASIEKIGGKAFENCPLTNLTIPDSIQSIEFSTPRYGTADTFKGSKLPLAIRKRLMDFGYKDGF